jgi:hypothetical protein
MSFKDEAIAAARAMEQTQERERQRRSEDRKRTLRERKTQAEAKAIERAREWFSEVANTELTTTDLILEYLFLQLSNGFANIPDNTPGQESWMSSVLLAWTAEDERFVAQYSYTYTNNTGGSPTPPYESFEVWVNCAGSYALATTKEELGAALLGRGYLKRNSWESGGTWSPKFSVVPWQR